MTRTASKEPSNGKNPDRTPHATKALDPTSPDGKVRPLEGRRILITGGAGFIGSHLCDRLSLANDVVVIDNLSAGKLEFIQHHLDKGSVRFIEGDVLDEETIESAMQGVDLVIHMAANPDARVGPENTWIHIDQNIISTYRVLEAMRKNGVRDIIFPSTSTVYGEAKEIPTPEEYGPMVPISFYAASKLACESLISAFSDNFDMQAAVYRFANVVGNRSTHGVTFDFVHKLKKDPSTLEILGDGRQTKSYFHITDCIDAMVHAYENNPDRYGIFNIGSKDYIDVTTVANAVVRAMDLQDVHYAYTGGVDGGRGWKGDVRVMLLSVEKLRKLGWEPKFTSEESIEMTAKSVLEDFFGE
jgi:UDP-glucose 4-epimerase